jgi:hypothetical protein
VTQKATILYTKRKAYSFAFEATKQLAHPFEFAIGAESLWDA